MSEAEIEKAAKKKRKKDKKDKKHKKEKKSSKKRKKLDSNSSPNIEEPCHKRSKGVENNLSNLTGELNFPIQYVLAPMVGASELPFRILCRKYGAQACYTPMMSSTKFASDPKYREEEFQTIKEDRPLVCHFSANDPKEFTEAAKLVQDKCDAIDLNLGCPQRTAYLGHFGSYLLEPKDRKLICDIITMASENVSVPIFVKIRLLNTIEETIQLCQQLKDAGASSIAIHARYRASFERKGAGARDGPALLDQFVKVREALGVDFPLIANGNVITYDDVEKNMQFTKAAGIMSAEGILDNPALYLPRYGDDEDNEIEIADPSPLSSPNTDVDHKKKRKLLKKLREIEEMEAKIASIDMANLPQEQKDKLAKKESIIKSLSELEQDSEGNNSSGPTMKLVKVKELKRVETDNTILALEYLDLAEMYPTKLRTIIFHTRRMMKRELDNYQMMAECISSKSVKDIRKLISKISKYAKDPSSFKFDKEKSQKEKDAAERKKREEGKRKAYEARMVRKAKREGLTDLEHYLRQGAKVPTAKFLETLKKLPRKEQMTIWKNDHSQHCLAFHLESGGCSRDRACAFLHVDAKGENSFAELDEIAG